MGRNKKDIVERNKVTAAFVTAAAQIIEEEGLGAASIRKISARAGYSSATMYLYFDSINKLLIMATMSYLRDYVRELAQSVPDDLSAEETFFLVWEIFCKHSFTNAEVFYQLLYAPHTASLDDTVKEYYGIFPEELDSISGATLSMLLAGNPYKRNLALLEPYAEELGLSCEERELANSIITAFHRDIVYRIKNNELPDQSPEESIDEFMRALRFVVSSHAS